MVNILFCPVAVHPSCPDPSNNIIVVIVVTIVKLSVACVSMTSLRCRAPQSAHSKTSLLWRYLRLWRESDVKTMLGRRYNLLCKKHSGISTNVPFTWLSRALSSWTPPGKSAGTTCPYSTLGGSLLLSLPPAWASAFRKKYS